MKNFRVLLATGAIVCCSLAAVLWTFPAHGAGTVSAQATEVTGSTPTKPASATPGPARIPFTPTGLSDMLYPPPVACSPSLRSGLATVADLEAVLTRVYAEVNPSVVHIQGRLNVQELPTEEPQEPAPSELPDQAGQGSLQEEWSGSGFVWDREGHIVTNNHVVKDTDRLYVTFSDGRRVPAEIVGQAEQVDLAVLKVAVPREMLHPVTLADSTQAGVGQFVVAIGNPFGYQGTMTFGIISALGRSLATVEEGAPLNAAPEIIPDIIQTDAPVNPGNSGGVLADLRGRVIGVPSDGVPYYQWSVGVSFAIPSVIVQRVVPALIENGHYELPWLGANSLTLTPEDAKAMGLPETQQGALVIDVTVNSPADKAGVRGSSKRVTIEGEDWLIGGDVIIAVDGQKVERSEDIVTYLVRHVQPGQMVKLTVIRDRREVTIPVVAGTRAGPTTEETLGEEKDGGAWLGIDGMTLTGELARAMQVDAGQQGLLIQSVVAGSPADRAGLRGGYRKHSVGGEWVMVGGDIITEADDRPLAATEDLADILRVKLPGDELPLTILRDGNELNVLVTLAAPPEKTM